MNAYVVDTNVAVVANGHAQQAGPKCVQSCISGLRCALDGVIVLDEKMRILSEYMRKLNMKGQPGPGDFFMKCVFQRQMDSGKCERVVLSSRSSDPDDFDQFPQDQELASFDRSDRKFVAVALASQNAPEVLNAVDSDWWDFREALSRHSVRIKFLCPEQFASS